MKAHLIEEIIPMHFVPRGETGLPEHCFQSMYELVIDGRETGSGCADLDGIRLLAREVYGVEGDIPVLETRFSGF